MSRRLKIRFEGKTPGLADGRLSLHAFAEPLALLLSAFRGVASQLQSAAADDGPASGRFTKDAKLLDLQILVVSENSVALEVVPATLADQIPLLPESLLDRTLQELLDSVEAESNGQCRNRRVRKFLSKLPSGIDRQDWSVWTNGTNERSVSVGELKLADDQESLGSSLTTLSGTVVGVDFVPERVRVRVDNHVHQLEADKGLVEQAIDLRDCNAVFKVVSAEGRARRLLWMRSEPFRAPDREDLARQIATDWSETLRILAT